MPHYVVEITYRAPLARIDETLAAHRAHLAERLRPGLAARLRPPGAAQRRHPPGPRPTRAALEAFIAQDPYRLQDLADYRLIEFQPVKHQAWAAEWFIG